MSRHRGQIGDAGSCESPARLYCSMCREWDGKRCDSGRASKCQTCSVIKLGDLRSVARSGVPESMLGLVCLMTLTGPGRRLLPWDASVCRHAPDVVCSGPLGCRVESLPAAAWHSTMPSRWSWFVEYLRRSVGRDLAYFKVYEWQQRGVLHVHALVRLPDGVSAKSFARAVRLCSLRWGFGKPDIRWLPVGDVPTQLREGVPAARSPRRAAAGYVAKYCTKGYEDLGAVLQLDRSTGALSSRCIRPWSASRHWGETMRDCKSRRLGFWAGAAASASLLASGAPPGGGAALDPYMNRSTTAGAPMPFVDLSALLV